MQVLQGGATGDYTERPASAAPQERALVDNMQVSGQIAKCASCGWLSVENDGPAEETEPSKEVTCGMCRRLQRIENASQEVVREMSSRLDGICEEMQRAAGDKTRIAQLMQRVQCLEEEKVVDAAKLVELGHKIAELEGKIAQLEDKHPAADRHPSSDKDSCGSNSGSQQGKTPPVTEGNGNPEIPEARGAGGKNGTLDSRVQVPISGTSVEKTAPAERVSAEEGTSHSSVQQSSNRPPEGLLREVLVVGDGNVGRVAATLVRDIGIPDSVEFLYRREATAKQAHEFVTLYEMQARDVARSYVLHVGLNEVLRGEAEQLTPRLEEMWKGKEASLVVCSIPEVTTKGREVQAKTVLVNEELHAWCRRSGARFLDLAKVLSPNCFTRDGVRYSHEGVQRVARAMAEAVAPFLGKQRPPVTPAPNDRKGGRYPRKQALWRAVETLVEGLRQNYTPTANRKWQQ
ncbi:hypothetical protein HPB48_010132 [Haemaphysalis longicornis]|uniref:Uncharacterized protein n=1 Tax=Haemaphysalis longicornis TaxID=44386 RepID=A0A9J6FD13_HAELO|nr:hypothetical protein HPB48_010132 [Haemaphysalis longicornis]